MWAGAASADQLPQLCDGSASPLEGEGTRRLVLPQIDALLLHAVDVRPAAAEIGPAAEQRCHRVTDEGEPIAHRLLCGRSAVHLHRAADPAEYGLVIGAQELEPVIDARLDGARGDAFDRQPGALQRLE